MPEQRYFAPQAWLGPAEDERGEGGGDGEGGEGGWARDVLLTVAADGTWQSVTAGSRADGATVLEGPVLPGLVDAHSHAFQRAIAGLTEHGGGRQDDFWSWRDRMYSAALRITPEQLQDIATQLYLELRRGGYTQVCEFHYLHNDLDGRPYADPLALSMALVRAAQAAEVGLTLLPTLYMRAGFGAAGLRDDQRRFASTPETVLRIAEAVNALGLPTVNAGVALHSLRAVDDGALAEVAQACRRRAWPVHIHIAEQVQEVQDCLGHHGQRPIERLLSLLAGAGAPLDPRWNLVHATHATPEELEALQRSGAHVVICPSTEANLGDGIFDFAGWSEIGGSWSVGSDSHVTRRWSEELRLLEYAQRLARRQRNVAARLGGTDSSAAALLRGALAGGSAAAGLALGGLRGGQRADLCVLDPRSSALAGIPGSRLLDALVFSSPDAAFRSTVIAGVERPPGPAVHPGFLAAMAGLWQA